MEVTVSHFLTLQKYINSKENVMQILSELKNYTACLGNISKDFTIDNMKKKTGLKGCVKVFSVNYNSIATSVTTDIRYA